MQSERNKRYEQNHKEQRNESHKLWARNNAAQVNARRRQRNEEHRRDVIWHYGAECSCCGENVLAFLTIDHIDGYKSGPRSGDRLYRWIINNNYPEGFQVLCMNCNWAKGQSQERICPHKKLSEVLYPNLSIHPNRSME